MSKRVSNKKGKPSRNHGAAVGKHRLRLEIQQAIAKRTAQNMLTAAEKKEAEHEKQDQPRQAPAKFMNRAREFFNTNHFKRGARKQ